MNLDFTVDPRIIHHGYDRKTCWVQTRVGAIPPHTGIATTRKLRLSGSDNALFVSKMRWNRPNLLAPAAG
jgi:hypothetical protein